MNKKNYSPLVWFILGFGIFMFTRMSKLVPTIPIAILIAPIFILRFNRTQPKKRSHLLTLLGFILSINIGLWGLFDLGDGFASLAYNLVRSSLLAVLYFLPYLIDRSIYARYKKYGLVSTLIFPIITTGIFFLSSLEGPFDGTIQSGKFVYGPIIFKQLLSLFGIWSFIFISSWLASIINYAWENNFAWKKFRTAAIAYVLIIASLFVFGAIKTLFIGDDTSTVKIAAIVLLPEDGEAVPMDKAWADKLVSPFESSISRIEALTETAVQNGAKIVSFQETAMMIHQIDEERIRAEYQRIAQENNVYLSITYAYYATEGKGENKHLLIDNYGEIQLDYTKRYLVGIGDIGEPGVYIKGPEIIQSIDTPYGKIGLSICRDMEFAHYLRQAGTASVDIMLSPAYEFPKGLTVSPVYLRTIENGFSLVRPTYNGYSIAVDYNGKILNRMDSDETKDGIMYADLPIRGVNTLYPKVGDVLGWICAGGLLGFILLSIIQSARQKKRMRQDRTITAEQGVLPSA